MNNVSIHRAIFSGCETNYTGKEFFGAELTAIFGGVDCDLRGAIIKNDCYIEAVAVFGGIEIFLPDNVNLEIESTAIFGETENKRHISHIENAPVVYLKTFSFFGGVDIK